MNSSLLFIYINVVTLLKGEYSVSSCFDKNVVILVKGKNSHFLFLDTNTVKREGLFLFLMNEKDSVL